MTLISRLVAFALIVLAIALERVKPLGRARRVVQGIALILCVVLVWVSFPRAGRPAVATATRSAEVHDTAARLATLDRSLQAVADGDRTTPRDHWDPDDVVRTVGRDPHALLRWVGNNTFWIPYRGSLRGPVGVLMDRQGNSLDRALLLAELLKRAGHAARLAHGELTRDRALSLLPRLVAERDAGVAVPTPAPLATGPQVVNAAASYRLDRDAIGATMDAQEHALAAFDAELRHRVDDQTRRLLTSLKGVALSNDWRKRFADAVASLQDHWWIQWDNGGQWSDLDPLDGQAVPSETVDPAALPQDAHHQLAIRVIAEQWIDGKTTERKELEYTANAADFIGQSVVLQFWPFQRLDAHNEAVSSDLRRSTLDEDAWIAILLVGKEAVAKQLMLDTGDDASSSSQQPGGAFGGLAQSFGASMGQKQATKALTAVWLEYEVRIPGQPSVTARRTVFDLLGPAARASGATAPLAMNEERKLARGLALMMRTELLSIVCDFAPEFLAHLASQSLVANAPLLRGAAAGTFDPFDARSDAVLERTAPPISSLYTLALVRHDSNADAHRVFVDRPQLLTKHIYPSAADQGLQLGTTNDIVFNDVGVALTTVDGFKARLTQGVVDTNVETLVRFDAGAPANVADAYAGSSSWTTFSSPGEQFASVAAPEDVRARMRQDAHAGLVVIAPPSATKKGETFAGWWRVDPLTGQTLGIAPSGWGAGQSLVEDIVKNWWAALRATTWRQFAMRFASGFVFDYFFCVVAHTAERPLTTAESLFPALTTIHSIATDGFHPSAKLITVRFTAALAKSPRECGPHAAAWGIATAVLPILFLTLRGVLAARAARMLAAAAEATEAGGGPKGPPPVEPPVAGARGTGPGRGAGPGRGGPPGGSPGSGPPGSAPGEPPPDAPPPKEPPPCDPAANPAAEPAGQAPSPTLQALEDQLAAAQKGRDAAAVTKDQALDKFIDATNRFLKYQENMPETGSGAPPPPNYDYGVARQLEQQIVEAQLAYREAEAAYFQTVADVGKLMGEVNVARAEQMMNQGGGACGGGGASPGAEPPPADPPLPDKTLVDPRVQVGPPAGQNPFAQTQVNPFGSTQPGIPDGVVSPGPKAQVGPQSPGLNPFGSTQPGGPPGPPPAAPGGGTPPGPPPPGSQTNPLATTQNPLATTQPGAQVAGAMGAAQSLAGSGGPGGGR